MMTEEISKYVQNTGTIILGADDINITKHDEDTREQVYFVYLSLCGIVCSFYFGGVLKIKSNLLHNSY